MTGMPCSSSEKKEKVRAEFHRFFQSGGNINTTANHFFKGGSPQYHRRINPYRIRLERCQPKSGCTVGFPCASRQAGHHLKSQRKPCFSDQVRRPLHIGGGMSPVIPGEDHVVHTLSAEFHRRYPSGQELGENRPVHIVRPGRQANSSKNAPLNKRKGCVQ